MFIEGRKTDTNSELHSGFTLIELLVAIALTGIIMSALLTVFFSFIQSQATSQDRSDALESVRFMLSDIAREVSFGSNYRCPGSAATCACLIFTDQLNRRVKIQRAANGVVEKSVKLYDSAPNDCSSGNWAPLTDTSTNITALSFEIETDSNKQPRVKISADAEYDYDGTQQTFSVKTQITKRILEPSQNVASTFRIGSESNIADDSVNFAVFTERSSSDSTVVCKTGDGFELGGAAASACERKQSPVAAEFTTKGLYVLTDSRLIFFIPQADIDSALQASGATTDSGTAVYRKFGTTSGGETIQKKPSRVVGYRGCKICNDNPNNITSLHQGERYLYARGFNGSVYQVWDGASATIYATRRVTGGVIRNTMSHISTLSQPDGHHRLFTLFRDADGINKLRLYTIHSSDFGKSYLTNRDILSDSDSTAQPCEEFVGIPNSGSARCRQLWPDDSDSTNVAPANLKTALSSISLASIDRLQVLNISNTNIAPTDSIHIWYFSGGKKHLLSFKGDRPTGQTEYKLQNRASQSGANHPDTLLASGGPFSYSNGLNTYTFVCDSAGALCNIDPFTLPSTAPSASVGANNKIALPSGIRFLDSGRDTTPHLHFNGYPIGVDNKGRLIYFKNTFNSTRFSDNNAYFTAPVYNTTAKRVLCDALPYKNDPTDSERTRQVAFEYISKKHPSRDIVALVGAVVRDNTTMHEVFLLVPTDKTARVQFGQEDTTVCGRTGSEEYVERFHLDAPTGESGLAFDLIRLRGFEFKDTK